MKELLTKFTSGRFLLTVSCAWVFIELSVRGMLSGEAVAAILVSVFKDYFQRTDRILNVEKDTTVIK